ncbi:MAG TPA: c-type cytochrome [Nitrospiraceae bacterium]|nr:c-type cytochrome [Nitrospiraceae bacterium]
MAEQPSVVKNVIKKGVIGLVVGVVLVGLAKAFAFPPVFQGMFFGYAMLGAAVFALLDAPTLRPLSGFKAVVALLVFYGVLSGVYIGGASFLPQFDPEDEKGKIEKLLKAKRAATEQGKAEELLARTKALSEKADVIMQRLQSVGGGAVASVAPSADGEKPAGGSAAASGDLVALGKEQWNLQECYNCHKLFGEGGKKRGPELDNIGNLMKPDELREKVLDPQSWMAEGFEKEYEKKKMPDKYKELMEEKEVTALIAFLATLKNPSVSTPKPIKKK